MGHEVLIVGGGIAGLATALSLHAEGIDVAVQRIVPEIQPLGVGINLLPHAIRELDALGVLDELERRHCEHDPRLLLGAVSSSGRNPGRAVDTSGHSVLHRGTLRWCFTTPSRATWRRRGGWTSPHRYRSPRQRCDRPFECRDGSGDTESVDATSLSPTEFTQRFANNGSPTRNAVMEWSLTGVERRI